ncbi:S8 family peptidase [Lactiplantibacillus plantarum]|uniref:S8 family peptidase n=1 Tax=Lactiplantibacillus plantarum TaxID=1590 RepID=UPI001AAE5AC4|nr:S8 family serine peptidase [Lactiplantibacillus plantarum]MBO2705781.1 S8 family serine peptidase [Lactiplantibacillus plantarum]MDN7038285.1 hypothetical protein [Lactiplantibacillus plantarum]MDO7795378.1 S8 family serine peptidase [Lactiplantibacillus plantarum]WVI00480.1 S8 family serine peptidase [Lactiplantibacillus plantarum]
MVKKTIKMICGAIVLSCSIAMTDTIHATTGVKASSSTYTVLSSTKNEVSLAHYLEAQHISIVYRINEIGYFQVKLNQLQRERVNHNFPNVEISRTTGTDVESTNAITGKGSNKLKNKILNLEWDINAVTKNGAAYKRMNHNSAATVAVIDSGIDFKTSALKHAKQGTQLNFVPKGGYDNEEAAEHGNLHYNTDLTGHGTAVAGEIAGAGDYKGVAPGVKVRSYRVFGDKKSKAAWIIKAITVAAKDKVDVINISAGQYLNKDNKLDKADILAYKKAINLASSRNINVVAAVGNDGIDENNSDQMTKAYGTDATAGTNVVGDYPANFDNVISVGSSNQNNIKSIFSNFSLTKSNFILAPGGDTKLFNKVGADEWVKENLISKEGVLVLNPTEQYSYSLGTSLATPKVSGILAAIRAKYHCDSTGAQKRLLDSSGKTSDGFRFLDGNSALK